MPDFLLNLLVTLGLAAALEGGEAAVKYQEPEAPYPRAEPVPSAPLEVAAPRTATEEQRAAAAAELAELRARAKAATKPLEDRGRIVR